MHEPRVGNMYEGMACYVHHHLTNLVEILLGFEARDNTNFLE